MSLKRDLRLIQALNCRHRWYGGELGSPRFCADCHVGSSGRFDYRVRLLRSLLGVPVRDVPTGRDA